MRTRGLPVSPVGIAQAYAPWLDRLLVDRRDEACAPELTRLGVAADAADIVMTSRAHEAALAARLLEGR
jgi:hypothetical protein